MKLSDYLGHNIFLLSIRTLSKLITVLVIAVLARSLGTEEFGIYGTIVALVSFAGIISDFGLVIPSIRTISQNENNAVRVANDNIDTTVFWSVIGLGTITILGWKMSLPTGVVFLFGLSAILEIKSTNLIRLYEGNKRFTVISWFYLIERCIFAGAVLVPIILHGSVKEISIGYMVAYAILSISSYRYFSDDFGAIKFSFRWNNILRFSRIGLPFVSIYIFSTIYFKADLLIVNYLNGSIDAAIYSVVSRVFEAQGFIPLTFLTTTFPALANLYGDSSAIFKREFYKAFGAFAIAGIFLSLMIYFLSTEIIHILFSSRYDEAAILLKLLSPVFFFYYINSLLGYVLFAIKKEKIYLTVILFIAVISVVLNYLLLSQYGLKSTIYIRLCCEIFMTLVLWAILLKTNFFLVRGK